MNELVKIEGICKKYNGKYVIKDLSICIPPGRIIGLLGDNGIGKTTLLRLLGNISQIDKGTIVINTF